MDDASKPKDEETPETPVEGVKEEVAEEPQPEETAEETVDEKTEEETTEEKPEEQPKEETPTKEAPKAEESPKEESDKPAESPKEETPAEEKKEKQPTDKSEETPAKSETQEEPVKTEEKKEHKKEIQKKDHSDDFKYIVRIANTDIDGEKTLVRGLTSIKGVGMHISVLIVNETGIDKYAKMGDLKDAQIEKIQNALDNITKSAPAWMLNRRKDTETGEDIHLIGSDIDMRLRDEINIMKKIRSYRGIRHERGLTVRGQRTRANNRKGLALGVSKKREPSSK